MGTNKFGHIFWYADFFASALENRTEIMKKFIKHISFSRYVPSERNPIIDMDGPSDLTIKTNESN